MHRMKQFMIGAAFAGMLGGLVACSDGNVFSLAVGTCFDDIDAFYEEGGGGVEDVPIVECDEPHDNEVFALFDIAGDAFPGTSAVGTEAETGCVDRFEDYVGIDYASSRFVASWLTPTSQSWDAGDREVVCFLYDIDLAELEGSARDSGE